MKILNHSLLWKIDRIKTYLAKPVATESNYQELLEDLESFKTTIDRYKVKIAIVSIDEDLLNKTKLIHEETVLEHRDTLPYSSEVETTLLPSNINIILRNSDLVCLVVNPEDKRTYIEKKIINKANELEVEYFCLEIQPIINRQIDKKYFTKNLPVKISDFGDRSIGNYEEPICSVEQYATYLSNKLTQSYLKAQKKLESQVYKKIEKFFERGKGKEWKLIREQKETYLLNKECEEFRQKINQFPFRFNRLSQNHFKIIKQNINQSKASLMNPFLGDSLIHQVQDIIQNSEAVIDREEKKEYLSLVTKENNYKRSIQKNILEICQNRLDECLEEQWDIINNSSSNGGLPEFYNRLRSEMEFLNGLDIPELQYFCPRKPEFNLFDYICTSTVKKINRKLFEYHYTQSSFFRLGIFIILGSVIWQFTGRLYGFMILVFQLVNLLTGQSAKQQRLKQQTKELKRIVEGKYQFLIRFLTDKLFQEIHNSLDKVTHYYQEAIDNILHHAQQQLEEVKQNIATYKERINNLKEDQSAVVNILKNNLN